MLKQNLAMHLSSSFYPQFLNLLTINEDLINNNRNTDVKFYQTQIYFLNTGYYIPNKFKKNLENFENQILL